MRRLNVLIQGLPPGSRLMRNLGGDAAWSYEEHAIINAAHITHTYLVNLFGGKGSHAPQKPAPPEVGWQEKQAESEAKQKRSISRLKKAAEERQALLQAAQDNPELLT